MSRAEARPGPERVETYLRFRAEEVISHATRPGYELIEELSALGDAARALAGAGLVSPSVASALLLETEDALLVRGASWIDPAIPDLPGLGAMHSAWAGSGKGSLLRVVAIGRYLSAGSAGGRTLTSLEVWDDRGVIRYADEVGAPGSSEFTPAPNPDDPSLVVQIAPGSTATVDFSSGANTRALETRVTPVDPAAYIERLEWSTAVRSDRGIATPAVASATRALEDLGFVIAETAPLDPHAVEPLDWPSEGLSGVVALALKVEDGYVASVERWLSHWRLRMPRIAAATSASTIWSATDSAGQRYGGNVLRDDVVLFRPALPATASLTVAVMEAGMRREFDLVVEST